MVFPFTAMAAGRVGQIAVPMMPFRLTNGSATVVDAALLDTGASMNVLPYDLGVRLGFDWASNNMPIPLAGNLARHVAKVVFVECQVGNFPPVRMAFGWSQSPAAKLLLGQINFFEEFHVCFLRSRNEFEVKPKP